MSDITFAGLGIAEPILRELTARQELVRLLCVRARFEQARGQGQAARASLAEAEALAGELRVRPDSETGLAIERARRSIPEPGATP